MRPSQTYQAVKFSSHSRKPALNTMTYLVKRQSRPRSGKRKLRLASGSSTPSRKSPTTPTTGFTNYESRRLLQIACNLPFLQRSFKQLATSLQPPLRVPLAYPLRKYPSYGYFPNLTSFFQNQISRFRILYRIARFWRKCKTKKCPQAHCRPCERALKNSGKLFAWHRKIRLLFG